LIVIFFSGFGIKGKYKIAVDVTCYKTSQEKISISL